MVIHLPIWKPTSIVYMEEFALSRCFFFRLHQSVHHWHDMTTMSLDVACEMGDHSIYSMERNSSVLPLTAAMKHLGTWKWKHWRIIWSISKINMMTKNQGSMRVMQVNFLHPTSKTSMQQRQAFNLNPSEEREPALPTTRQIYLFHKSLGQHLKKICRTVSKTNKKWTSSLMYIIYRVSVYNYILYIYMECIIYTYFYSSFVFRTASWSSNLKHPKHIDWRLPLAPNNQRFPELSHAGHGKTGVFLQCDNFFSWRLDEYKTKRVFFPTPKTN